MKRYDQWRQRQSRSVTGKMETVFTVARGLGSERFEAAFGTPSVTDESHFQLPNLARAAVGVDGKEAHVMAISSATEV